MIRIESGAAIMVATLTACSPWPDLDPVDTESPLDSRLGVEVARTSDNLRISSVFQDSGLLVVYEDGAAGWSTRLVDPTSFAVTSLPAPPADAGAFVDLGRATPPMQAVAIDTLVGVPRPYVLEAGADHWTKLPPPPGAIVDMANPLGQVLAHDGRVYFTSGKRTWVWNGTAWAEPVTSPGPVLLAGFGSTLQWMVTRQDTGELAAYPVGADGVAGDPVVGPAVTGDPTPSAVNGDDLGFQVAAGGTLYQFDGTTFTPGSAVTTGPWSAPGSSTILVSGGNDGTGDWRFAANATLGDIALAAFTPQLTCAPCAETTCTCIDHPVGLVQYRPSPDADGLALVMVDSVDGYAVLTTRALALPYSGDPFALPPP